LLFSRSKTDRQARSRRPSDLGSWLGIIGFLALGVGLLVNLGIAVFVALTAATPAFPGAADRMFLLIVLWGFVVPVAWAYGTRFVTIFLGLSEPNHRAARWLCPALVILVLAALTQEFWLADALALAGTLIAIHALRIFRPSHRAPKLVGVYRHYPAFIRLSYGWLLTGALLGVMADIWSNSPGLGGASRHAVTVGFIATLIFALAPRLLPAFLSGRELFSSALMAASLWVLTLGCALRVTSEAVAYSSPSGAAWSILPLSAFLELIAVIVFVINMGFTLKQSTPAWFEPASATAELPLHWYIASFPETKSILINAGLKTLASVRDAPRSLSLGEAARADDVAVEEVLERLRGFFRNRQPRRRGRNA
ncbi:MAG: NnrS family protein, partial [Terriglobia bacterium]